MISSLSWPVRLWKSHTVNVVEGSTLWQRAFAAQSQVSHSQLSNLLGQAIKWGVYRTTHSHMCWHTRQDVPQQHAHCALHECQVRHQPARGRAQRCDQPQRKPRVVRRCARGAHVAQQHMAQLLSALHGKPFTCAIALAGVCDEQEDTFNKTWRRSPSNRCAKRGWRCSFEDEAGRQGNGDVPLNVAIDVPEGKLPGPQGSSSACAGICACKWADKGGHSPEPAGLLGRRSAPATPSLLEAVGRDSAPPKGRAAGWLQAFACQGSSGQAAACTCANNQS